MCTLPVMHRFYVLPLLVSALFAAACTSSGDDSLTVYSGRSEELVGPVFEDFTEATGIKINPRYESSDFLAVLIEEEGDKTPADVFHLSEPGRHWLPRRGGPPCRHCRTRFWVWCPAPCGTQTASGSA